jgi:hypothetical protein
MSGSWQNFAKNQAPYLLTNPMYGLEYSIEFPGKPCISKLVMRRKNMQTDSQGFTNPYVSITAGTVS